MAGALDGAGRAKMDALEEAGAILQRVHAMVERYALAVKQQQNSSVFVLQIKRALEPMVGLLKAQFGLIADQASAVILASTRGGSENTRVRGLREGVAILQSLHTTAGLTINENADPDVVHDVVAKMAELLPQREPYYQHAEGNSDSHLKTSFFGPSLSVIVTGGELLLGTWQAVMLVELDGPRERRIVVTIR